MSAPVQSPDSCSLPQARIIELLQRQVSLQQELIGVVNEQLLMQQGPCCQLHEQMIVVQGQLIGVCNQLQVVTMAHCRRQLEVVQGELDDCRQRIKEVEAALAAAQRAGKRQAYPFSRGTTATRRKSPAARKVRASSVTGSSPNASRTTRIRHP